VGASVAAYAAKELKVRNVGVIDDRTAFGQGIAMEFKRQAQQAGAIVAKQPGGPAFLASYKKRFGRDPDVYAPSFYDQTRFIAQAIVQAKSVDAKLVGTAMHTIAYQGVVGSYGYDAKGNLKKTAVTVYTFKNGALTPLASY
jgi:ABC-type branched-subunit amino acid transport system substrate-binding protein